MAKHRRQRSRSRLTLVLLILTSITLLTLDSREFGPIDSARSAVLGALAPVGDLLGSAAQPVSDVWSGAFSYDELRQENDELVQRIQDLEGAEAEAEAARLELAQLAEDLDLEGVGEVDSVTARVTSGGIVNFDETIQIDRGTDDGVARGMPVVGGAGLVGQVEQVAGDRAVVQLITDSTFRVGVRVAGAPGLGVVEGQGDETTAWATSFDIGTELAEDDVLVTSGAARSAFPPDVHVGRVADVHEDTVGLQTEAEVELLAQLSNLRYVTVLLWEPIE